jgi:glycosyltransferase involved in cell wall biosynthesis
LKILHVLNSDFGSASTMGYRSYQIVKNSGVDINVFCRANLSKDIKRNVSKPYPFVRWYSRATQLVLKTFGQGMFYNILKKVEIDVFSFLARKFIRNAQIIHFFYHDERLIDYAKSQGKKVIIEAFSHPDYLKKMRKDGIQFDSDNDTSDDHSIPCYEKSDVIISPSPWVSENLSYAGLPESKVNFIPYGVHPQPDKSYDNYKKLKIVFAGGLKRTKGVLELVEAVGKFAPENVELDIFGRMHSNVAKDLNKLIHGKKNIHIKGFSKNIIEEYKLGDLYVYPSYFEGSSKTVFEAMSCGLPVITTFNAGSIVRDNVDGFIVPVNDSNAIVEKIKQLLAEPTLLVTMGCAAQKYSREFSWEQYGANVSAIYCEIFIANLEN